MADQGLTIRQLVKRLQFEGIRPRKSSRGVWNTSTLSTLLRNRTYIGEAHYGASYAVVPERPLKTEGYRRIKKTSRRMRPEDEWIKIRTPALIEPALFDRAQRQLQESLKLARRNRKNQYLLSGKIRCICGLTRCGEGPQRGRHLYYRCSSRSYCYPQTRTCNEHGVNARIADTLVWEKLTDLMSSPDLLRAQAERCLRKQQDKTTDSADSSAIEAELTKLRAEEDRYAKAYGAGLFNVDQLKSYAAPIRTRIAALERELPKAGSADSISTRLATPETIDIDRFASEAADKLRNLKFEEKRAIVSRVIKKVVGSQRELSVTGCLAIPTHVEYQPNDRDGVSTTRLAANDNSRVLPFEFLIPLPAPNYQTIKRRHEVRAAA